MHIVRFRTPRGAVRLGVREPNGHLDALGAPEITLADLLRLPEDELRQLTSSPQRESLPDDVSVALLAPIDRATEVWAAGVTYRRSEQARMEESQTPDIYSRVYAADRPELFFKASPRRVAGPDEPVAIRSDSAWDVPGAGAGNRRQCRRPDRRVHHRQRRQLPQHRGRESAVSATGESLCRLLRARTRRGAGLGSSRSVSTRDPHAHPAQRPDRLAGRDEHQRAEAPTRRAGELSLPRGRLPGRRRRLHRHGAGAGQSLHTGGRRRGRDRDRPAGHTSQSGGGGQGAPGAAWPAARA